MASSRHLWVSVVSLCLCATFVVGALLGLAGAGLAPDLEALVTGAKACTPTWRATVPLRIVEHDVVVPVTLDDHDAEFVFDTGDAAAFGHADRTAAAQPRSVIPRHERCEFRLREDEGV